MADQNPKHTDKVLPVNDPVVPQEKNDINLTEEDKETYYKCFIADKPYEEIIPIFSGKSSVKFATMSVQDNDDVYHQIVLDKERSLAKENDGYLIRVSLYRLALSLKEVDGKPFMADLSRDKVEEQKGDTYVSARAKKFDAMPAFKVSALLDVFNYFEQRVTQLTRVVKDPAFWKAAA